jgi:hypothetical protein
VTAQVIAIRIGQSPLTVRRDVAVNGGRSQCRAWRAHERAGIAAQPINKEAKLAAGLLPRK